MSCSLYDAVELEKRGVPTVAVHTEVFMNSATAHALAFGRPDLESVGIQHPIAGLTPAEVKGRAEDVIEDIVGLLTGREQETHEHIDN